MFFCLSMIFSENRFPLFRIMLQLPNAAGMSLLARLRASGLAEDPQTPATICLRLFIGGDYQKAARIEIHKAGTTL
jgi:hypothetical protein